MVIPPKASYFPSIPRVEIKLLGIQVKGLYIGHILYIKFRDQARSFLKKFFTP